MKENISMVTAVLAIIISIIAVTSGVFLKPVSTLGASSVGENELADNSVTSSKVAPDTLTDDDISDTGISKIADNAITSDHITASSITLLDLSSEVIAAMTGMVDIANNSITGEKIANGTITNVHISGSADIDPSKILGTAWTAANDGSGSGLNADILDGVEGDNYLRSDQSGEINGDLTVNGRINHTPTTRYYTVSGCEFMPHDYQTPYQVSIGRLVNPDPAYTGHYYYAPVHLPHEAEITNVSVRYYSSDADAEARIDMTTGNIGGPINMEYLPMGNGWETHNIPISNYEISAKESCYVDIWLEPNDDKYDVQILWVSISYNVTNSLP